MHTELYCTTLDELDPVQAIRAIHEAWAQLAAVSPYSITEGFDNAPAMASLAACLRAAGHSGFIEDPPHSGPDDEASPSEIRRD